MTNVINLTRHQETHVTRGLAKLLDMSRNGEIKGMMYVIAGKRSHHAGMYGTYREDPEAAIGIATAAMSKLYVYATKKRMNSMTATDFMVG